MRNGRRDIEKIRNKFPAFAKVDPAEAGGAAMIVHVNVEETDVSGSTVQSALHGLSDGPRPHDSRSAAVVHIVVVGDGLIVRDHDEQPAIFELRGTTGEEADALASERVSALKIATHVIKQRLSGAEQDSHR